MRKPFKIGNKQYKYKKDAISHYRTILNSYDFGQSLNDDDFHDLIDLMDFRYQFNLQSEPEDVSSHSIEPEDEVYVVDIKVAKVQFNTKCFEVFYSDNTSYYISYLMFINNTTYTPEKLFYVACRNSIIKDIREVKQKYFDCYSIKGQVKCQETGLLSKWTELVVDHRQPNTFSVIVDRFKEVYQINPDDLDYITDDQNNIIFSDHVWSGRFRKYHAEKANLRIVSAACNSSRANLGRINRMAKDLKI